VLCGARALSRASPSSSPRPGALPAMRGRRARPSAPACVTFAGAGPMTHMERLPFGAASTPAAVRVLVLSARARPRVLNAVVGKPHHPSGGDGSAARAVRHRESPSAVRGPALFPLRLGAAPARARNACVVRRCSWPAASRGFGACGACRSAPRQPAGVRGPALLATCMATALARAPAPLTEPLCEPAALRTRGDGRTA
jgi:hypothetical protein